MFIQAEFQIFKQFDFDIIFPTAVDMMLQVLFLECEQSSNLNLTQKQSSGINFLKCLSLEEKEQLSKLAIPKIY